MKTNISRSISALGFALAACALCGCDSLNGVRRQAKLDEVPPPQCLANVIASAPGVVSMNQDFRSGGVAITFSGLKSPAEKTYSFMYRGTTESHITGVLQIHDLTHGPTILLSDTLLLINRIPAQENVDATRQVMKWIEERVATQCGPADLPARIVESCQKVACPN